MNLYDQDEDSHGETTDLATGEKIDNSTFQATDEHEISVRESFPHDGDGDDASIDKETVNDDAAKWLQENDPELKEAA